MAKCNSDEVKRVIGPDIVCGKCDKGQQPSTVLCEIKLRLIFA